MSASDYTTWTVDDVSNWLSQINLSSLVPSFERLGINGSQLAQIDEPFIKERLRMSKPSEVQALRGAIFALRDSSPPIPPLTAGGGATRRVSAQVGLPARPQSIAAPASNRIRMNSYDKTANTGATAPSKTLPNRSLTTPPGGFKQPMLATGTAQVLLEDCRHCGWIIKQGGGYKNWKRRYLILRKGCLYYFANETASAPKGQFILTGYKTEICKEAEITKKYKNILKLAPMNPHIRTYYIAVGSKKELDAWKQVIDEEIASVTRSLSGRGGPTLMGNGGSSHGVLDRNHYQDQGAELDDEDEDDETKIYEDMDDNDEHNYDIPEDATEAIYEQPPDHDDSSSDEDDPYSKIDADLSPQHLFNFGADGRPVVPRRSEVSLQDSPHHRGGGGPGNPSRNINIPTDVDEMPEDPTYLPIIGSGPATNPAASMPGPSPTAVATANEPKSPTRESQSPPTAPKPPATDADYEDDGNFNPDDDDDDGDDGDPYYIMIPKADELMPKECIFDRLERADADKLLRTLNRDGTYLIRGGSHAGADKVLSVWHIDRCRHYKLFKGSNGQFSLTQGQSFRTIPELLQYYSLQSHLPRSDFYLGDPYNPNDY